MKDWMNSINSKKIIKNPLSSKEFIDKLSECEWNINEDLFDNIINHIKGKPILLLEYIFQVEWNLWKLWKTILWGINSNKTYKEILTSSLKEDKYHEIWKDIYIHIMKNPKLFQSHRNQIRDKFWTHMSIIWLTKWLSNFDSLIQVKPENIEKALLLWNIELNDELIKKITILWMSCSSLWAIYLTNNPITNNLKWSVVDTISNNFKIVNSSLVESYLSDIYKNIYDILKNSKDFSNRDMYYISKVFDELFEKHSLYVELDTRLNWWKWLNSKQLWKVEKFKTLVSGFKLSKNEKIKNWIENIENTYSSTFKYGIRDIKANIPLEFKNKIFEWWYQIEWYIQMLEKQKLLTQSLAHIIVNNCIEHYPEYTLRVFSYFKSKNIPIRKWWKPEKYKSNIKDKNKNNIDSYKDLINIFWKEKDKILKEVTKKDFYIFGKDILQNKENFEYFQESLQRIFKEDIEFNNEMKKNIRNPQNKILLDQFKSYQFIDSNLI